MVRFFENRQERRAERQERRMQRRGDYQYVGADTALPPPAPAVDQSNLRTTVDRYVSADAAYMENAFKQLIAGIEQRSGVTLDSARANSVEARRQNLKSRLEDLQKRHFNNESEFHMERNRLVEQIHALKSYVEYQLEQQKEMGAATPEQSESGAIEGIERDASGRQIWIPLQANETLSFNYVTNNPQVSRLLGRITFEPNSISSRMPGTYTLQRTTYNGKSYAVLMPDPSFSGTFTVMIGNKRSLVEVGTDAEIQAERARSIRNRSPERPRGSDAPPGGSNPEQPSFPERNFIPPTTIDWTSPVNYLTAKRVHDALDNEWLELTRNMTVLMQAREQNPGDRNIRDQLNRSTDRVNELNKQIEKLAAIIEKKEPTSATESRPNLLEHKRADGQPSFTGVEREKAMYTFLRDKPNKSPMWYKDVPGGKSDCEYMIASDGHLYGRRLEGGIAVTNYVFDLNKNDWKPLAAPTGR